jgi:predicted transcriptional regulator
VSDEFGDLSVMMLELIKSNPGCHLRKIQKNMNISMGTTQYHLDKLEKMGRITSNRSGIHKHYFPVGLFAENEKEILQVLSQETPREIIMIIIERQAPTQTEIMSVVKISKASANWHLKRLLSVKLIIEIKDGKYKHYRIVDMKTSKYVVTLMQNYYPSIWNNWSNRLIEIFLSLSTGVERK